VSDEEAAVTVGRFEVTVDEDGTVYIFDEGLDDMISGGPLDRLHHEQGRAQIAALVDQALSRPAYGSFDDEGRRFRLLPGDNGHRLAALLSITGARIA
jgi:hypothetical protein